MVIFNSFWLVYQKVQALETTLKWDAYPSTYGSPYGPTVVPIRLRYPGRLESIALARKCRITTTGAGGQGRFEQQGDHGDLSTINEDRTR